MCAAPNEVACRTPQLRSSFRSCFLPEHIGEVRADEDRKSGECLSPVGREAIRIAIYILHG